VLLAAVVALGANPGWARDDVNQAPAPPVTGGILDRLVITVPPEAPRPFLFTNKRAAFYAGMTSGPNSSEYHGFNVFGRKAVEDFEIRVSGVPLDRRTATAFVTPDRIVRAYPNGVRETITPIDWDDALIVDISLPGEAAAVQLALRLPAATKPPTVADAGMMNYKTPVPPVLIATPAEGSDIEQSTPRSVSAWAYPVGESHAKPMDGAGSEFVGTVDIKPTKAATFVITVGATEDHCFGLNRALADELEDIRYARSQRISDLVAETWVETADERFNRARSWVVASGDALVTEQAGRGIWAGLYWFNNYWGRDTFIALPGLRLVTGQFDDARDILLSFAKFQKTDPRDPLFGRVPNRVNSPTDIIYNTADGTPWFVREAWEYVAYTGDREFAREIFPSVRRATEGTIRYRLDRQGFLTHDDADTWMDAKLDGKVPWSPRGNRAVEIQALWHAQLDASARLARLAGQHQLAAAWTARANALAQSFRVAYAEPGSGGLVDHLNADGTKDTQIRPNPIFALTVPLRPLVTKSAGEPVLRQVFNELVYPYGVASLSPRDPDFKPWHHDPKWHFDSAYHNGNVWLWNSGPVSTALVRYGRRDLAWSLTDAMVDLVLERGTVGTIPELLDATPRNGRIGLSGAESQAWSLSEFLRVVHEDYLGVRPDLLRGIVTIDPRLPQALGRVTTTIRLGRAASAELTIVPDTIRPGRNATWTVTLVPLKSVPGLRVSIGGAAPVAVIAKRPIRGIAREGKGELTGLSGLTGKQ
jgi:glycogen debranching enzyme